MTDRYDSMVDALQDLQQFDRKACHEHARETFNSAATAKAYQQCYERVLSGEMLNPSEPYADENLHAPLPLH